MPRQTRCSIEFLGTGDGQPCPDRSHSSFLYRLGPTTLLVDCGDGTSSRFAAAGFAANLVDALFISHLHADHAAGFFMLMQHFWLRGRTRPLPVRLPADGLKPVNAMLRAGHIFPELLKFRLRCQPLKSGATVRVGSARITAFPTSHLDRLRATFQGRYRQKFEAFSFLIEAAGRRIAHSADIGRPEDLEPLLQKPLNLLVCELAHMPPRDLFNYLRGREIQRIAFVHLPDRLWRDLAGTRRLARRHLPGVPITFPRDGDSLAF